MPRSRSLTRTEILFVMAVAVLARLAAAVVFDLRGLAQPYGEPWQIARNLHAGGGFAFDWYGLVSGGEVGSFLPPLYPWLLSLALDVTGGRGLPALYLAQGLNIVLGAATCLLVAQLTARGSKPAPERPGASTWRRLLDRRPLLAGLVWALYPPALGHAAAAHTPVLEGFLLILLAWLMLRGLDTSRWTWPLTAGVALGLLLLVRPSHGLVWLAWSGLVLWRGRLRPAALRPVVVTALVAAAVVAPWTVRNARVHGALIPVATNGGFNFYLGNNPQMAGDIPPLDHFFDDFAPGDPADWRARGEVARDRAFYALGREHWRERPGQALRGAGNRLVSYAFFRPYLLVAYPRWLAVIFIGSYLAVLLPFLWALPRARGTVARFSLAALAVTGLVGMAYVVSMRFRASVEPFLVVVAAARPDA